MAGALRSLAGSAVVRGVLAGTAGGTAMTVSTNAEMRLRGRPPSRVPAQAVERLLSIDLDERQEQRLVTAGHVATSALLGAVRGVLDRPGIPPPAADAAFATTAFLPDFALLPSAGASPPPWRWGAVEIAISALHHSVYAAATVAAYRALAASAA